MQPLEFPRLRELGDGAWIVEFGREVSEAVHSRVMGFARSLGEARERLPGIVEWVSAYTTVTVHFEACTDGDSALDAAGALLALARAALPLERPGRRWRLPVCFDADFAPDLEPLARARGLEPVQVIALMTGATFRVFMLGFQPGFPYMGGLPAALEMPRRATPRTDVPERSVAIAQRMCAVYPWRSPGGWHLIGRTPLMLFDPGDARSPAWLEAGDEVTWIAVDRAEFDRIERLGAAGRVVRDHWRAGEAAA
jgi:KipI family sensor histidine kinase inhibitor